MASWRDPSGTCTLELDETHKHATVVEPLRQRAAQSTPGRDARRRLACVLPGESGCRLIVAAPWSMLFWDLGTAMASVLILHGCRRI